MTTHGKIRQDLEVKSDGSVSVSAQMIDPRTIPGAYISGQFFLNGVNIHADGDNSDTQTGPALRPYSITALGIKQWVYIRP